MVVNIHYYCGNAEISEMGRPFLYAFLWTPQPGIPTGTVFICLPTAELVNI